MANGKPRVVKTPEGAKRFGVPIGSVIIAREDGSVKVVSRGAGGAKGSIATPPPPRPDPNRVPTKFVATAPGQKAKLSGAIAGKTSTNGLKTPMRHALTNTSLITAEIGDLGQEVENALAAVERGEQLSEGQKSSLRNMIETVFKRVFNSGARTRTSDDEGGSKVKGSKVRTSKQKAATKKAQEASAKSTSPAKRKAQKAAQEAATKKSAWLRRLRGAYKALGGGVKDLPGQDAGSAESASSASGDTLPADIASSDNMRQGFTALDPKELTRVIRQLLYEIKTNPSAQAKSALYHAQAVRDGRNTNRADLEARRAKLTAKSGGAAT